LNPKLKTAICVAATGKASLRELAISLPSIKAYATRIGAELQIPNVSDSLSNAAMKFQAIEQMRHFDRVIWFDCDLIVRPGCPNLFEIVPREYIGVCVEYDYIPADFPAKAKEINQVEADFFSNGHYFNAGVIVFSQEHSPLFDLRGATEVRFGPQLDQSYVNVMARKLGFPLFYMTHDFNFIPHVYAITDRRFAWICHVAGNSLGHQKSDEVDNLIGLMGRTRLYSPAKLHGRHLRHVRLLSYWLEFNGQSCLAFDPDQIDYYQESKIVLWDSIAYSIFKGKQHSVVGMTPVFTLRPGQYRIDFLIDETLSEKGELYFQIIGNSNTIQVCPPTLYSSGMISEFTIEDSFINLRLRLLSAGYEFFSQGILISENSRFQSDRSALGIQNSF
jgi:hypothetical protein